MIESACAPSGTTLQASQSRTTHNDQHDYHPVAAAWSDSCRRRQTASCVGASQRVPCKPASGLCGAHRQSLFAPRMKGATSVLLARCMQPCEDDGHDMSFSVGHDRCAAIFFFSTNGARWRGLNGDACSMHAITLACISWVPRCCRGFWKRIGRPVPAPVFSVLMYVERCTGWHRGRACC